MRLARQARGISQEQLAGMAGVSRQAVSAVESGLSDPSLRVALALGRALGLTVEELFGPGSPVSPVSARPVAPLGNGDARVTLAPVGDEFVALPLSGASVSRAGFLPAGGLAFGADGPGTSSAPGPAGTTARQGLPAGQAPRAVSALGGTTPLQPPAAEQAPRDMFQLRARCLRYAFGVDARSGVAGLIS